jgi:hypothetical protein
LLKITVESLNEPRYFQNNEASRHVADAIEMAENRREAARTAGAEHGVGHTINTIAREIEWLESIDVYPPTPQDEQLVEEWLAQGYAQDDILHGIRAALNTPRPKGTPHRSLTFCIPQVTSHPPANPTAYYTMIVTPTEPPSDEVVAFRELAGRWPTGHEFNLVEAAVGIYGPVTTIEMLKRLVNPQRADADALLPLLAEREEAELALAREQVLPDLKVRDIIRLYETTFGLPPTSRIAQDINELADEVQDMEVWQGVFRYAATQNKREWNYVRKLLQNPSPAIFEPTPVNETARFAFQLYKRRVSRGILDPSVAREINELATQITDQAKWTDAVDKAARANALRWDYIRTTLMGPAKGTGSEVRDGRRKQGLGTRKGGVNRRPQVGEPTEEELEAARERARRRIAERARRGTPSGRGNDSSGA